MQRDASPLHRVDQAVDYVMWNVVPLLFNGCAKLLYIGGNWNTLSIQSIVWHCVGERFADVNVVNRVPHCAGVVTVWVGISYGQ